MTDGVIFNQCINDIRKIYAADKENAEAGIEAYLRDTLSSRPDAKKITIVEQMARRFEARSIGLSAGAVLNQNIMEGIFSFLLGKNLSQVELSPDELMERMAESLNTIFDTLNQLVGSINTAFCGEHDSEETIRQVIGYHMGNTVTDNSLESYLAKITKAFLVAQQAFELAAETTIQQVVDDLNPERITASITGGLKIGPLQKAESFRLYRHKFEALRQWIDSGHYMKQVRSEFEKNCQNLFMEGETGHGEIIPD
ncbi:MAG: hypothetical protein HKM93_09670 [Desulfobacteraceae bacterium]|nr:hypothetical protein [Desulfobacteraceae bacterium]